MGKIILSILFLAALVGAGVYFIQKDQEAQTEQIATQDFTETSTNSAGTNTSTTPDELMAGGSSFADPKGVYTILYPNDYTQDVQGNGQYVRFYKLGATQQGQTEMYDGVNVTIEVVDIGNQTLSQWVDTKIKESTADGTLQVTEEKTPITIKEYPGFRYKMRGLGEGTYYVIQKDTDSKNAVVITYMVADPENVGFQSEVDQMLLTINLLK